MEVLGWIVAAYFLLFSIILLSDSELGKDEVIFLIFYPITVPYALAVRLYRKRKYTCKTCGGWYGDNWSFRAHKESGRCERKLEDEREYDALIHSKLTPYVAYVIKNGSKIEKVVMFDEDKSDYLTFSSLNELKKNGNLWYRTVSMTRSEFDSLSTKDVDKLIRMRELSETA